MFDAWEEVEYWTYPEEDTNMDHGAYGPKDGSKDEGWTEAASAHYWLKGRGCTKSHACRMDLLAAARVLRI